MYDAIVIGARCAGATAAVRAAMYPQAFFNDENLGQIMSGTTLSA